MERKDKDYEDICVMMLMYSMHVLQYRGIPVLETVVKSLQTLMRWHEESREEKGCLDIMELELQAYVNMGRGLDKENDTIKKALELLKKAPEDFWPQGYFAGKCVRLTRPQVRQEISDYWLPPSKKGSWG